MAHCEWPKFHGHFHSVPTAPLGQPGRTRGYASVELCAMLDRLRRASARDCTFSRSAAASGIVVVRCVRFAIRRACRRGDEEGKLVAAINARSV